MAITQEITDLPTPPTRTDSATFDARADAFLTALDDLASEINTWAGQANSTASDVDTDQATVAADKAIVAADKATTAGYKDDAETARDEAEAAVATLPEGTIDDLLIASDKAWSSEKIDSEITDTSATTEIRMKYLGVL